MRVRTKNEGVSVHAVAGTHVVCLGMSTIVRARKGLLGFSIERKEKGRAKGTWLKGARYFRDHVPESHEPGMPMTSDVAPIQEFFWGDYTARPGRTYNYTVYPAYGKPGAIERGGGVSVEVTTERTDDKQHGVFFNRGVAGSQSYSRRFDDHRRWYKVDQYGRDRWREFIRPGDVPDHKAFEWLSRGLEEALLGFLSQARGKNWGLRAAVYEFEYHPAVQGFVDALERGADVKIVYDAKQSGKNKTGPWRATEHALGEIGLRDRRNVDRFESMAIKRTITTISHNKFVVLLKNGKPVQVWTGSANMTLGGIFGQSNVGHIVRDPDVAAKYLAYWEKLSTDPERKDFRQWNVDQQPDLSGPAPANQVTPIFSPRPTLGMLDWYSDRLAKAKHSVHFTAAFGVNQDLAKKLLGKRKTDAKNPFLRYIMLESKPSPASSKKRKDAAKEKGRPVPLDYYDIVKNGSNRIAAGGVLRNRNNAAARALARAEALSGLDTHVEFLHTKFMLVDPLTDDPTVITGSANFSDASTRSNDENMLVIRGNTRVADIFFGEFMRMFNHFRYRNMLNEMSDHEFVETFFLREDDSWTAPYWEAGSQEREERLLFA